MGVRGWGVFSLSGMGPVSWTTFTIFTPGVGGCFGDGGCILDDFSEFSLFSHDERAVGLTEICSQLFSLFSLLLILRSEN